MENVVRFEVAWKHIDGIPREHFLSKVEAFALFRMAARTETSIVEIGSWQGRSTVTLALATPGVVYAIDPHHGTFSGNVTASGKSTYEHLVQNLKKAGIDNKVRIVRKLSDDAVDDVPSQIGMLFIDGQHTLKACSADLQNYWPKLVVGGWIAFHDFGPESPFRGLNRLYDVLTRSPSLDSMILSHRLYWGRKAQKELIYDSP